MSEKKAGKFAVIANKLSQMRETPPPESQAHPATVAEEPRRLGRPPGKKTSPDYVQVTVYLRRSVHQSARKLLIDERRQFSDLVDELVENWVQKSERLES